MPEEARLPIEATPAGAAFRLHVRPGARRNAIGGLHDGALRVEVTTAPEKGKANKAVLALLAKTTATARRDWTLLAGESSPRKRVACAALDPQALRERLGADDRSAGTP